MLMINHKNQGFTEQESILCRLIYSLIKFQNKLRINQHSKTASLNSKVTGFYKKGKGNLQN